MVQLSNERVEQILQKETKKTEALPLILRAIYTRYMNLFEDYFANLDKLDNEKIAEYRKQHEETKSLIKYYYMDIPHDICSALRELDENGSDKMLGIEWKKYIYEAFDEFKEKSDYWEEKSEEHYMVEFKKEALKEFYENMEEVFRVGFGTGSQTAKEVMDGISGLLFGKKEK